MRESSQDEGTAVKAHREGAGVTGTRYFRCGLEGADRVTVDWLWFPRRLGRWVRYAVRPPALVVVHHPSYGEIALGGLMDPGRGEKILAFLIAEGFVRRRDVFRARHASMRNILRVHRAEYLESLSDPAVVGDVLGQTLREQEAEAALDMARRMVGGTIQATRVALRTGRVVAHLAGGLHHATADEGMGFCLLNDVAVAIRRLRARGFDEPILVVDLDLHDGNGTRAIFAGDPTVYTFSIHNIPWDERGAAAATTIALGSAVTDEVLLETLRRELPPVFEAHRPGLVFYLAGVDGAATDALGDWGLTARGILERDQFVTGLCRRPDEPIPLVVVLAGGYGSSAWRYSARYLGWLASDEVVEPPDDAEIVSRRFRELWADWEREERKEGQRSSGFELGLTEEDVFGIVTHSESRFLGQFHVHAIELQLEQLGLLDAMRARGFPHLAVLLSAPPGLGQMLRVSGDPEGKDVLMELKAQRSRSVLPGFEVLEIEWLRLQNPRAQFTPARPQLPGQDHPGLGMLRDVAAWLIVLCERLRLDGLVFVPSQYYIAAVGNRKLGFVAPEAQAHFDAMRSLLKGMTLRAANAAVVDGRIRERRTGAVVPWEPRPMVMPISRALTRYVTDPARREAVARERAQVDFVLGDEGLKR